MPPIPEAQNHPESGELQDRRSAQRRSVQEARSPLSGEYARAASSTLRRPPVLPDTFPWMAPAVAGAFAIAALVCFCLPPILGAGAGVLATLIAYCSRYFVAWEKADERDQHMAFALGSAIVAATGLLAGTGIGLWLFFGELDVRLAVAVMVTINAVFATVLSGRTPLQFAAKLACWLPIVILDGSIFAFAGLALATAVSAAIARYQSQLDRRNEMEEEAKARVRDRAQSILADYEETGQGWFWETDRRGQLTYLSTSVARTLGRSKKDLIGRPLIQLFDLADNSAEGERTLTFHLSARSSFQDLAVRAAVRGEERWWSVNGRPVYDGFRNFCGFRGSGTDLTEKKRSQENATRLAQFDSLTGLANRHNMSQMLEKILASPHERDRECAIMLLDLDRFKNVNDTLGHPAGDALLKQVAHRLQRTVGKMGQCGRLGGDEFKVIIPGRTPLERLGELAHEIIRSLSQPYSIEGQRVVIGASVGIAVSPDNGMNSETIIRNADLALYAAKDGGRGRYHFFSEDLHSKAEERNQLEQDLRDAIANGGLELHYQPVVDVASEQISGFEALLRWNHQVQGWMSPDRFIPVAEDAGLISAIGEWALRTACHDLARWPESIRCAVNVSTLQFGNPQFATVVTNAIAQARIDPARLELEITESVFLSDDHGTDAMFAALKRIGVRLALDDFGTGYSSLGYLKRAPFDKIKIDQSFVRGATQPGSRNGAIIASITGLAQSLGMDTTAEGVETLDELELVRRYGCSHIQGYVYAKPMSSADATARLQQGLAIVASGPRSARAKRFTMLRKVVLEHGGHYYQGTIRNMSMSGAMVEGLWNVPVGTQFNIAITEAFTIVATSRWSEEDRMGVEFARPLDVEEDGTISLLAWEKKGLLSRTG
ncbi:EAL domain-containing protein [Altererythrobacter sp. H2]|uniref:EAL domain-containing protein n=1 Tax=Altererythrobacter sp. H2 TaxID=3108391 RepID=UPI003A5CCBA2